MKETRHTDLLLGMVSCCIEDNRQKHYFLADLDEKDRNKVEDMAMKLVQKFRTGNIYVVKSGKGYHLISFSKPVDINAYIKMLRFVKSDPMFVKWVKKVGYGVLRISRRSSHMQVPCVVSVMVSPYGIKENEMQKAFYLSALLYEQKINQVKRVLVEYRRYDVNGK
jgi:hypothetical protein